MKDSGLGDQRIVFSNKRGVYEHVKQTIESAYPKIKEAGGFEILRTGGPSRSLEIVEIPATGYTVEDLKETFGQAIGYIRPLQKHINRDYVVKVKLVYADSVVNTSHIKGELYPKIKFVLFVRTFEITE